MNSPLAREDTEKHAGTRSCSYCNKVFTNYRALGGHLRIHQEGKPSGTLNYLGSSSNSIDTTRNPPASLPNSQRNSLPGVNNLTPFTSSPPPFDPSWGICSNETNHASMSGFTDGNPGGSQTQNVMFPNYSHGCACACACHHGSLASGRFVPTGPHPALSSTAFTPSSTVVTPGFDIDTSLHLGPNGVGQFNTDEFQISRDGLPPTRGDALQTVQGYNLGPPPSSSPDKGGQNDGRSLVMCGKGKRLYLADESGKPGVTNVSKKPKISPSVNVEPEKPKIVPNADLEPENLGGKELPLFVDVDNSVPAARDFFGAEKGPVDVDLSLHL
ncbi:hypothetical protein HRI_000962400 [Hibiscus trionum]|uniref:C2H2-type domain-containing protein n=1 Tax=Hibiscus trionum TaxID=183268 RepID=A0A9W7H8N3_HIBTR|nr:hypothetical protein HRI_000962400 [Hibiscus trionum]